MGATELKLGAILFRPFARAVGVAGAVAVVFAFCAPIRSLHAQVVEEEGPNTGKAFLADGVFEQGGRLSFATSEKRQRVFRVAAALEDWEILGRTEGGLIQLRDRHDQLRFRLTTLGGADVGIVAVPSSSSTARVSDRSAVILPQAPHGPLRPHALTFTSLKGRILNEVVEPDLLLFSSSFGARGEVITVNKRHDGARIIIVYSANGRARWRHQHASGGFPEVLLTPDGRRVALLELNGMSGRSTLTLVRKGDHVFKQHSLPQAYRMVASPDAQHIAVVGKHTIALVNARSGDLEWVKDVDVDLVAPQGIAFDLASAILSVVSLERNRPAGGPGIAFTRVAIDGGYVSRVDLGEMPPGSPPPTVREIIQLGNGDIRLVMHDRILRVPGGYHP